MLGILGVITGKVCFDISNVAYTNGYLLYGLLFGIAGLVLQYYGLLELWLGVCDGIDSLKSQLSSNSDVNSNNTTNDVTNVTNPNGRKGGPAHQGKISDIKNTPTEGSYDTELYIATPGGYKKAMQGIQNLINVGKFQHIQVTTVVTHQNIGELDQLFEIFDKMDINSWRVINIEPMGRANRHPELLLTKEDYKYLMEFIRNKRLNGEPVEYGCSHYLGEVYEHEIRDWYFFCAAGLYVASITTSGDIIACLDIERRPEFIQGNILKDRFKDVWYNKFKEFRIDLSDNCTQCQQCSEKDRCHGDSFHSWNFEENRPNLCFKDILF